MKISPSSHIINLAWAQLSHERGRLLVAMAGIAFADMLMFMQLGFQEALYDSNTRIHRNLLADLVLISPQSKALMDLKPISRHRLYQSLRSQQVKSVAPAYIYGGDWRNPETGEKRILLVLGLDPSKPVLNLPEVNQQLARLKLGNTVLFDRASRPEFGPIAAELARGKVVETELNGRQVKVGGLVELGTSFAADGNVVLSTETFLQAFPDRDKNKISLGLLRLKSGANPETVRQQLAALLPEDVRVLTRQEFIDLEKHYWATGTPIGFIFTVGMGLGYVVGVVIVYQILASDVADHAAEYATLKAMGYRNGYLLGVVFQEAVILAILGFIPGSGVAVGLYSLTRSATNLPLYMTLSRTITVLLLTLIMCMMSGAIATRKLRAADPADIF
jgi:putative ABC transport system permease protein